MSIAAYKGSTTLVLSDGAVLDIQTFLNAEPSKLRSLAYTVHVPTGATVTAKSLEQTPYATVSVTVVADLADLHYSVSALATLDISDTGKTGNALIVRAPEKALDAQVATATAVASSANEQDSTVTMTVALA